MKEGTKKIVDLNLMIVGVVFLIILIPTIVGDNKPEAITSIGMALLLCNIAVCYQLLRLRFATVMSYAQATLWLILFIQVITK